jgi:hypothetical protein
LQVSSLQEIVAAGPPHTHGVWSTTCVLPVCVVQHLSDTSNLEHKLRHCSGLGWRVPSLEKLGQACSWIGTWFYLIKS